MAIDLLKLNKQFQPLPELTIKTVDDPESLRTWSNVLAKGFDMPGFAGKAFFNFYSSAGLGTHSPVRHYIGWLDGEPVATSSLFFGAGVAGIYNLATIPSARRQGGGSSTIMKPLQEARKLGYRAGILQSSEMGVSVYRRLGFREYCRLSHYVWSIDSKHGDRQAV